MQIEKKKTLIAAISVASNTTLVLFKFLVGLLIGSVSVMSEAIHSGVDAIAAAIAYFAVKTSSKPADADHPFGHGKYENISGTVEALLIFVAAIWIIYEAIMKLLHPEPVEQIGWGIGVMAVSSIMNIIVSHFLFKIGKESDSIALEADAWHLRTDVYTSAGVAFGLLVIWIGKHFWPNTDLHWIDPVAAMMVALMIIHAAWDLTRRSFSDLVDGSLPQEEEDWIKSYLRQVDKSVSGFHKLKTRKSGPYRFIEFHMLVPEDMSVKSSHDITDRIEDEIKKRLPRTSVNIHIEPCNGHCTPTCKDGCLITDWNVKKENLQK